MSHLHEIDPEPTDRGVVDALQRTLDEADTIAAVGIAIVYRDGTGSSRWSEGLSALRLIGAADRLRHKLNRDMDDA